MKQRTFTIQAGAFKAQCLQLMDQVSEQHISIVITKHGKPVAKLTPIDDTPLELFGCLKDRVTVKKDIIAPIDVKWEASE